MEHSVGDGVFCEVFQTQRITEQDCAKIKKEMQTIVANDLPIERLDVKTEEALDIFSSMGRKDLIENFRYNYKSTVTIYRCGKYYDYYIRPLADRTGMIKEFDLLFEAPGLILRFPGSKECKISTPFSLPKKIFALHQEHDKWLNILDVHKVIDINRLK